MTEKNDDYRVAAQGAGVTMSNRPDARNVPLPGDLPGIVIFIHGVNDPGAACSVVEQGLCQGVNDRLSRTDLKAGRYGVGYLSAARKPKADVDIADAEVLSDPDTYLYRRTEIANLTKSFFIPFYWGMRADNSDIAKIDNPGEVKSRTADENGNLMTRGQYQDIHGNRLDAHFAKAGGFFANATNNIPQMYDEGFKADRKTRFVTRHALGGNTVYAADSPSRRYFVLAATRLANLITTIRTIQPKTVAEAHGLNPANETITIMGHSQGTIIALLAQAILKQQGQRCVDCLIMVDSPYSLYQTEACNQTGHAKLKTLIDIVNAVTQEPHTIPDLAELMINHEKHGGRTGAGWTKTQGKRLDESGKRWVTFDERDNRGKVYLYFCPEDAVVGLKKIRGIGTFGVPDAVPADGDALKTNPGKTMPAMPVLGQQKSGQRFFQRMWTRMERDQDGSGKFEKVKVGLPPARLSVRERFERLAPGPETDGSISGTALEMSKSAFLHASFERDDIRFINGEELKPPCVPDLYGGEVVRGGPRPGKADVAGLTGLDDVTKNIVLGNQYAKLKWKMVERFVMGAPGDLERVKAEFNANKAVDDQSENWRIRPVPFMAMGNPGSKMAYCVEREETPNEARARMRTDRGAYEVNNYHSGILRSAGNHRWVTAMDVAIGQAVTLDDPVWRELLILMADWRMDDSALFKIKNNLNYKRLNQGAQDFIQACADYYSVGIFPEKYVSSTFPPLVTSELTSTAAFASRRVQVEYEKREAQEVRMVDGSKKLRQVLQGYRQ
ncbi:DUF3274 domain-containing protein [Burkholderia sp. FERM BP-3421]|uniref:T6SS effector phospholipase Tle3 domain-containing protein n=1 Tax=Burkholderia sp. FERM BP-3421 TaxID=1494466 RepID=UPI002362C47E|nr:DUF3274 domain-containing protein [Burkholderia sp. FERM BP-3421]WDD91222.1 DUF3274 domain-containing protein [Burkholderia sp. FERM BP-3421]